MAENYIEVFHTWATSEVGTAARFNGNVSNLTDGLNGGAKAVNIGKILIGGTEVLNSSREISNVTKLGVDNIEINGNTLASTTGDINITPLAGEDVVIDEHWQFDGNDLTAITDNDTLINAYAGKAIVIDGHFDFDGPVLTAITDNNTTITAYTGKNITIESVTFDGGVMTGVDYLTANQIHSTQYFTPSFMSGSASGNSGTYVTIATGYIHLPTPSVSALEIFVAGSSGGGGTWTGQIIISEMDNSTGGFGDDKTKEFATTVSITNPVRSRYEVDLSDMSLDGALQWYRVVIQVLRSAPDTWTAIAGAGLVHN